jgi:hypothetical protein
MLRQFVSKATRPKLPGGLLLSPGLSLRVPSKGALSAPGGAGFILYRRANPIPYCRASWPEPSKRGKEFSHWQLNPRLSRAFFAALSDVLHFGMGSRSPFTSSSLCKMRCKPRLCIRIVWVPGASAQQSFYLLDRFATRSTPTKIGAIVQVTRIDPGMVFT